MKKYLSLILAAFLVFSLCACGQSAPTESSPLKSAAGNSAVVREEMAFDVESPAEAPSPAYGGESMENTDIDPEKIIYSAEITLETTEFESCLKNLAELINNYGGYIESGSKSDASFFAKCKGEAVFRDATYTIRIPVDKFSQINGDLSQLGNIPYSHTYTENVSAQYYDTEQRLKVYTAQEERLLEMLDIAESIEDVLAIEHELSEIRYDIESLQSHLKNWDRRINYSTIYLSIQEVSEYTDTPAPSLNYAQRLWRSLKNGFLSVGNFFADFLLWLVGAVPAIAVITILIIILRPVFRRIKTKRRERKEHKNRNADT